MTVLANSSLPYGRDPMYFPLTEGARWEYDVEVVRSGGAPRTLKATRIVRGEKEVDGKRYVKFVTETSGAGMRVPDQFYRASEQGIYAAVQGAEGKELLLLPRHPEDGHTWHGEAQPAITKLSGEVALGETFAYEALRFSDCVRVSLSMTIMERSFFGGEKEVPVRFVRWFAPGTGMVRELRIVAEEGDSGYLRMDSKLTGFHIP